MLEHHILCICNFRILLFSFEYLEFYMQVLTDVQKRDGSFELRTIFYTQTVRNKDAYTKETKDGSYIYQILSRSSRIQGWKKCRKIGHFTSLMIFKALLV